MLDMRTHNRVLSLDLSNEAGLQWNLAIVASSLLCNAYNIFIYFVYFFERSITVAESHVIIRMCIRVIESTPRKNEDADRRAFLHH